MDTLEEGQIIVDALNRMPQQSNSTTCILQIPRSRSHGPFRNHTHPFVVVVVVVVIVSLLLLVVLSSALCLFVCLFVCPSSFLFILFSNEDTGVVVPIHRARPPPRVRHKNEIRVRVADRARLSFALFVVPIIARVLGGSSRHGHRDDDDGVRARGVAPSSSSFTSSSRVVAATLDGDVENVGDCHLGRDRVVGFWTEPGGAVREEKAENGVGVYPRGVEAELSREG